MSLSPSLLAASYVMLSLSKYEGLLQRVTLRPASVYVELRRDKQCDINDGKFSLSLLAASYVMQSSSKYESLLQRMTLRPASVYVEL